MKSLYELVAPYDSVSLIGMCKNAGKTTTLNQLIAELKRNGVSFGATSVGRDGESTDLVTNTVKPGIFVYKGTIVATAADLLKYCDTTREILCSTGIYTPMGEIIIFRARTDGFVQIAGPSMTSQLAEVSELIRPYGVDKILIDGALGRKSLCSRKVSQSTILCTGASYHKSMATVVRDTAYTCEILQLPQAPFEVPEFFVEIIEDELNIKKVSFIEDVSAYTNYSFKPQLRTVGPKYGKFLGKIKAALENIDGHAAMAQLKKEGSITLSEVDENIVLTEEDLLISVAQTEGFATETGNDITVVLNTKLTPELIEEGFVREIISKVQTMRKDAGFEVMDKIVLSFKAEKTICDVFAAHKEQIQSEVLAVEIKEGALEGYQKEWNINGHKVELGVEKQ